MNTIRIGVASKDGFNVDEHFGKAQGFLIYDYNAGKLNFVEKRLTEPYSVGDPNHSFDKERFDRISDLIKDCTRIYVQNIGKVPAGKLRELGIEPIIYEGSIMYIAQTLNELRTD